MASADQVGGISFPVSALLPRKETGVINLLNKYPTFDGRGTIIAIFDSGTDPGAQGMQVTTEGKVKIIDRFDASGAGDVDTSTVVEAIDGVITGLTGRKLKVPNSWNNPIGKFHIGVKGAFSLYPSQLKDRIIKERKETLWNPVHKALLADAQRKVQNLVGHRDSNGRISANGNTTVVEKMAKEDAEARVTLLTTLGKKFIDLGPVYDCVVYHDGDVWRACIDTSEEGDLQSGIHLGEYFHTHQWAALTRTDQLNVSVNVHHEGNLLEIVATCSGHGTHTACIAAANFPDTPEKNGVAPGAQIVSISIGDNRLRSMETMTGLIRAMIHVMNNRNYKVDVINQSYGEHSHWSDPGRFAELAEEVVHKHGIIYVSSVGNSGPALTTVTVPPDCLTDSIIGVSAYVSPEMMTAEYAMIEKLPGCVYTWSSRGPTADGGRGVSVCAPGAAITSVPTFTLRNNQLMNGTSMASPHAAGCISLLISALKQHTIPYTPYSLRRALENTAHRLDLDAFAQGHGLIQIEKALEHITQRARTLKDKVRFVIECGGHSKKGIYLRNWHADTATDVNVQVEAVMLDEARADPNEKLNFSLELVLTCDAQWVKNPSCLQMSYTARNFKVSIDPRGLERGCVYFTSIQAFDVTCPDEGVVFEVPVTVVVPILELNHGYQYIRSAEVFRANGIHRHFLHVPHSATWASITLRASHSDKPQRFTVHAVQLKPDCNHTTLEYYKVICLNDNETTTLSFCVSDQYTLEICIARVWSSLVVGQLELTVDFHSLEPSTNEVSFLHSSGVQRIDVRSGFRSEDLAPVATLKHICQVLVPSESKVEVLAGDRDTLPEGRPLYQLTLSYNFNIAKATEVMPKPSLLSDVLYESAFESQLWQLFDVNKRHMATGDAYSRKYAVKLDKGEYVLRLHVRHEKNELLEKLTELPVHLLVKLNQEIKLDIFSSYNASVTGGKKFHNMTLSPRTVQPLYILAPNVLEKSLKNLGLGSGHSFMGQLSFAKDESVRKIDTYPLMVTVTEMPGKKRAGSYPPEEKKEGKTYADYQEAYRELQTAWIAKLDHDGAERLYQEVVTAQPDCLAAQLARLQALDVAVEAHRPQLVSIARQVEAAVDYSTLLAFYGTKTDTRPDSGKIKTQMDKQRNGILGAWSKRGSIFCMELLSVAVDERKQEMIDDVDEIASNILKFVESSDPKVVDFFINYYKMRGFEGSATQLVTKQCEDKWNREHYAKLLDAYTRLGWSHVAMALQKTVSLHFPSSYTPF